MRFVGSNSGSDLGVSSSISENSVSLTFLTVVCPCLSEDCSVNTMPFSSSSIDFYYSNSDAFMLAKANRGVKLLDREIFVDFSALETTSTQRENALVSFSVYMWWGNI